MKYRVKIDLSFTNRNHAIDLLNHIELIKNSVSSTDNDRRILRETSFHECYHDENLYQKCLDYIHINFDGEVITHN